MADGSLFRQRVEDAVERRIAPALRLHDGGLNVKDARDGEVWVTFTGACQACPSAQITMEEIVGQALAEELGEEFRAVHLVYETDEDLLDFARRLLGKKK